MTADTSDRKCRTFSPFKFGLHPPRHFSEIFLSLATARFSFHRIICTKSWIGWDYAESGLVLRQLRLTALCRPEGENSHQRTKSSLSNRPSISSVNLKQITITLVPFVKPQLMVEPLRGQKKKILLSSKLFTTAFTGSDLIEHFTRSFFTLI